MFANFNFQQMVSAFIVLFAVIDIIGSIPIIINLKEKGKDCCYFPTFDEIENFLLKNISRGQNPPTPGGLRL